VFQLKEIKDKSKETCKEKYGKEYYQQTDNFKDKYKQNEEYIKFLDDLRIEILFLLCENYLNRSEK
jgi:hypothetical protein